MDLPPFSKSKLPAISKDFCSAFIPTPINKLTIKRQLTFHNDGKQMKIEHASRLHSVLIQLFAISQKTSFLDTSMNKNFIFVPSLNSRPKLLRYTKIEIKFFFAGKCVCYVTAVDHSNIVFQLKLFTPQRPIARIK